MGVTELEQRPSVRPRLPTGLLEFVAVAWRLAFLAGLGVLSIIVLYRLRTVVVPVVVALMVAAILSPPVRYLERHGVSRLLGTWLVFLCIGVALVGLTAWVAPRVTAQFSDLGPTLAASADRASGWLTKGPLHLKAEQLDRWRADLGDAVNANRDSLVRGLLAGARRMVDVVTGGVLSIVLAFFFVKDGPRMNSWILDQLSEPLRRDVSNVGSRAWTTLGGYIRGSTADGLVEAALKAIGLLVLGVPLVVPLAFLTFFGGYLPFVGALLAGTVSASVALVAKGPGTALLVVALSFGIQTIEGHLLQPLIMRRAVKLHPTVVLISITTGGALAGILGAFLAVPAVATAVNVGDYFLHERRRQDDGGEPGSAPRSLQPEEALPPRRI